MEKFQKREAHPMEKYIGRPVTYRGGRTVVVGYSNNDLDDEPLLIIDASPFGGWTEIEPFDVVFKECESYWYANVDSLID